MGKPSKPFERYRTRSALFLMIYGVTALIFGIPNISIVTGSHESRVLPILITSILVVSRFIGYIKLAGFALLESEHIKKFSGRITFTLWVIVITLLANAAWLLSRSGLGNMPVNAVSMGCLFTAGVLITHLAQSTDRGMSRSRLMRMVSNVLIILGSADVAMSTGSLDSGFSHLTTISLSVGLMTLFFGIYTERKTLALAFRQTLAAASGAIGGGISLYFLRWYLDPNLIGTHYLSPPIAIVLGLTLTAIGIGYYIWSRKVYASDTSLTMVDQG